MMEVRKSEIYRYLGYSKRKKIEITPEIDHLIDECIADLKKVITPATVYKRLPLAWLDEKTIEVGGMQVASTSLAKNLQGCHEVFLFGATIGIGVDRMIKRAELSKMAKAAIYQATGAEMVERVCDELNEQLRQDVAQEGLYLKPRFSPGYGGTPLSLQRDFERILHMSTIGISLTETCLMVPSKSVTAFIGITDQKTKSVSGCAACDQQDCPSRKE